MSPHDLLKSRIYPVDIPYPKDTSEGWTPVRLFFGQTRTMAAIWGHLSVLKKDCWPHPPHRHEQEELLLLLSGEVDIIIPNAPDGQEHRRVRPGEFSYYPANFAHTVKTVSEQPANYLMFKWHGDLKHKGHRLGFCEHQAFDFRAGTEKEILSTRVLFQAQTDFLQGFHCHTSVLSPGQGYEPHADDYDVLIIVLEGEVETLGQRVGPYGVIYYAAGEPHGMRNPGTTAAKYIVFEFHGWPKTRLGRLCHPALVLLHKVTDPVRWRRKLQQLVNRGQG